MRAGGQRSAGAGLGLALLSALLAVLTITGVIELATEATAAGVGVAQLEHLRGRDQAQMLAAEVEEPFEELLVVGEQPA